MNDLVVKQLIGGQPSVEQRLKWAIDNFRFRVSQAADRLRTGKTTLPEFQQFGRDELKATYYMVAEIGKGAPLTRKEIYQVRRTLKEQVAYWDNFCQAIVDQRKALADKGLKGDELEDAFNNLYDKFDRRAQSYAGAVEATGEEWAMAGMWEDGQWFRWVRSPVESCKTCLDRDGKVWQMKDGRLPFYPRDGNSECLYNCMCHWEPISRLKAPVMKALGKLKQVFRRKSFDEIAEEWLEKGGPGSGWHAPPKGTHGTGGKGKANGESKIKETESKVLAHMPTREAAYVFDAKGNAVLQKDASREKPYEIRWEDDEIAKMKDATFTHNHPLTGGSFSESDVVFATQANLAEIRAVGTGPGVSGKTYLYKLTRPEKGWGEREKIEGDIDRIDGEVGDRLWVQVKEGKLRPEQAEFTHNHDVMQALASANEWKYTREEL